MAATTIDLNFYDGGGDYGAQAPAYSAPPQQTYSAPQPAYVAPAVYTPPAYTAPFGGYPSTSSLGTMESSTSHSSSLGFEEEPPLLEELGINFQHIYDKTVAVLHPTKNIDAHIMDDADLAGPLIFCLLFGSFLLASGKVHFGYIYGMGLLSCIGMYSTASVLGYSLLPMVALSSLSVLLSLYGVIGTIASAISVCWCTVSASRLFTAALSMHDQRLLVAYPCALIYGVFALLTVF